MFRKTLAVAALLIVCGVHPLLARTFVAEPPDLTIGQYQFVPSNDKALRVLVMNKGETASTACRLELTVRKINGTAVGRTMYATIPAIPAGGEKWVLLDAKGILPKAVSLKDTTFKLIADATKLVTESKEDNNETWHNLN